MTLPFAIINDTHGGAVRAGGTTPPTAYALRQWVIQQIASLLQRASGCDLLINGDLLDSEHIPYSDLLAIYQLLAQWVIDNRTSRLYLPPGNHDLSKTTTTLSSQQFLTELLVNMFGPERVVVPTAGMEIEVAGARGWVIPHMPNQELFNLELEKVPEVKYLFLHCNFDNKFAAQSDHSLNLSKEQAEKCLAKHIIFGHEHQKKMALVGKVLITGNQFPTSVADCLGNTDKYMLVIRPDKFEYEMTWEGADSFIRVDWRELGNVHPDLGQFIRVEGDALASEAPAVVSAISKLRKVHNAFVITNATTVEGRDQSVAAVSMEAVANFNVIAELLKMLEKNPAWAAKVKGIMEKNDVAA